VNLARNLLALLARDSSGIDPVFDEGQMWKYVKTSGVWTPIDTIEMTKRLVQPGGGRGYLAGKASDIRGAIEVASMLVGQSGYFTAAPQGIAFSDRFFKVARDKIVDLPHSPEHRARQSYACRSTASPPKLWLQTLGEIFRDDADVDDKVKLLQEFGGACLFGLATRYGKAILCQGPGDDGKSTIIETLIGAMPRGSTSNVRPELLEARKGEYYAASMMGKRLNAVAELPGGKLAETAMLKQLITGDQCSARHPSGRVVFFSPAAGHIYGCNELPRSADASEGFWRRWILLTFNRSFTNDPKRRVGLFEEILKREASNVAVWLIEGARRLVAQGKYTTPASSEPAKEEWRVENDVVLAFFREKCALALSPGGPRVGTPGDWTRASIVYDAYRDYAARTGHGVMGQNLFCQRLARILAAELPHGEQVRDVGSGRGKFYRVKLVDPRWTAGRSN